MQNSKNWCSTQNNKIWFRILNGGQIEHDGNETENVAALWVTVVKTEFSLQLMKAVHLAVISSARGKWSHTFSEN